jgi:hypothetical protein
MKSYIKHKCLMVHFNFELTFVAVGLVVKFPSDSKFIVIVFDVGPEARVEKGLGWVRVMSWVRGKNNGV